MGNKACKEEIKQKRTGFSVWYYSGEQEIDRIPSIPDSDLKRVDDYHDIVRDIGSNHISHMHIELDDVIPPLDIVCPHVTVLRMLNVNRSHKLDCMKSFQQLKVLHIQDSDFSAGLPDVISQITSLTELYLGDCQLTDVPQSIKEMNNLVSLLISSNNFTILPPVIYQLTNLQTLYMLNNKPLHRIDIELLQLNRLEVIDCNGCESLISPPYAVCRQGLSAIKKYFMDIRGEAGTSVNINL